MGSNNTKANEMNTSELRKACKVRGIKMRSKLGRDEMLAAIEAWETARSDKEIEAAQNWYYEQTRIELAGIRSGQEPVPDLAIKAAKTRADDYAGWPFSLQA
jgi:hypothetical protein